MKFVYKKMFFGTYKPLFYREPKGIKEGEKLQKNSEIGDRRSDISSDLSVLTSNLTGARLEQCKI